MREIILITISGEDKKGLTAAFTEDLARYNVSILDISQAVIHDTLSLGIMIEVPAEFESSPVLKDILYKANTLGVGIKFTPIDADRYENWVQAQGKPRYIITLVGRKIWARDLGRVAAVISTNDLNIEFINRLSGRISFCELRESPMACIELSVRGTPRDITAMRADFLNISGELGVDIGLQEDSPYRRNRRIVAFDMDSTLIATEVIDELAKRAGSGDVVARITESAMRGELDFKESLIKRVETLKGMPESTLEEVARTIPLTEGAERLISVLKGLGYKIAILSGGFTYFGRHLQSRLGIDYVYANELEVKDGLLTGKIKGDIVDGPKKAELLTKIARKEKISLKQVIAVGDGANDLPMLDIAGLGIAFHAKPVVRQEAEQTISNLGLDAILYFIGLREREVQI